MIRPWPEINAFYQDLVARGFRLEGMVQLIEQIEKSRYAEGIHGETSIYDLRIVQIAEGVQPHDANLRISPRFDGTMEFRYIDTHLGSKQWSRVTSDEHAFSRLVAFLHQLHWFSGRPDDARQ
jgi:hypothetical protein